MGKVIENPIDVRLIFNKDGTVWGVDPSVQYGLGVEEYPSLTMRKPLLLVLTPAQETQLKTFAKNVIYPQILANEGM